MLVIVWVPESFALRTVSLRSGVSPSEPGGDSSPTWGSSFRGLVPTSSLNQQPQRGAVLPPTPHHRQCAGMLFVVTLGTGYYWPPVGRAQVCSKCLNAQATPPSKFCLTPNIHSAEVEKTLLFLVTSFLYKFFLFLLFWGGAVLGMEARAWLMPGKRAVLEPHPQSNLYIIYK